MDHALIATDTDRFIDFGTPGAQEWWYFDAIGDDGRDAIVVVWYAGLPFDPEYGVGTLRHLADPSRRPAPAALDHCAIGISWYRDGRTIAYALNAYRRDDFEHRGDPWSVRVARSRVAREGGVYELRVDTPSVDGRRRIAADLRFRPAPATEPIGRDLGVPGAPHLWMLAAADCRVEGRLAIEGPRGAAVEFAGRGYHDHNAGSEEISLAMGRWQWGRVHDGRATHVYYLAEPRRGPARALRATFEDGRPISVVDDAPIEPMRPRRTVFGLRYAEELALPGLRWRHRRCVDSGPFYLRWLSEFEVGGARRPGLCELLDTRNLNRPWFNWMIPYRLKRPAP